MCRRVQGYILRARQGEKLIASVSAIQKEIEEALLDGEIVDLGGQRHRGCLALVRLFHYDTIE